MSVCGSCSLSSSPPRISAQFGALLRISVTSWSMCRVGGSLLSTSFSALPYSCFLGLCSLFYLQLCIVSFFSISTKINTNPDSCKVLNVWGGHSPRIEGTMPKNNLLDPLSKLYPPKSPPSHSSRPHCAARTLEPEVQPGPGTRSTFLRLPGRAPLDNGPDAAIHFAVAEHLGCLGARWMGMKPP